MRIEETFTVARPPEGPLRGPLRLAQPLVEWMTARQFRGFHQNLRRNVESS